MIEWLSVQVEAGSAHTYLRLPKRIASKLKVHSNKRVRARDVMRLFWSDGSGKNQAFEDYFDVMRLIFDRSIAVDFKSPKEGVSMTYRTKDGK